MTLLNDNFKSEKGVYRGPTAQEREREKKLSEAGNGRH
jgi:hypothetical protein